MGVKLDALNHENLRNLLGNFCASRVAVAIHGTNTENILTTVAAVFAIDGIFYTLAAQTEIDLSAITVSSGVGTVADGYTKIFLIQLNSAGTITVNAGDAVLTADITAGTKDAAFPEPEDDKVAIAAVKVANATGSAFTLGTTDLDTVGITDTYYNLCRVPVNF